MRFHPLFTVRASAVQGGSRIDGDDTDSGRRTRRAHPPRTVEVA